MINEDRSIENLTDRLKGFTEEVEAEVRNLVNCGYSINQAIEIVKIGVEDIKAETMHHLNKKLHALVEAYEERTNFILEERRILNEDNI